MATTVECYIEEYANDQGRLSARIRQKKTGKKVDLGFVGVESRNHFLRFLSAAMQNADHIPGVFLKDDDADCIKVSGDLDFEAPDEIRFMPNERLTYLFA